MALFVRPATWNYDQELFRRATDDELRLESMLAAIAQDNQNLWVVESNEQPVAFAWTRLERESVRFVEIHVDPSQSPNEPLRLLVTRITQEYAGRYSRLELDEKTASGACLDALREIGFHHEGRSWLLQL